MPNEPNDASPEEASQKRLRVLLMAGSMDAGGSERQTLLLLRHLDRKSFLPYLFLTHHQGPLLRDVPADVKVLAYDSKASPARQWGRWAAGLNWPGRRMQQQIRFLAECISRERIDVIYDRTFHMTMLAGPAAQRTGVPHVSTIVSLPHLAFPLMERRFRGWKKRLVARAYRSAARIIAVSDAAAESAAAFYGLPGSTIVTRRNPVDRDRLLAEARQPNDWAPVADCLNVACVARMTEEKGHADLLLALTQLEERKWHLWLLGDGPLRGSLEAMAQQLELTDRVHFLGHVDQVAGIVGRCQLLVLPSHYEGMPNAVLEAMMLGVPVIATNSGGTAELIQDGRFGTLVPTGDPTAIRMAIDDFLRDPGAHRSRAQQAKAEVTAEYSVDRAVPQIEAILRDAVAKRPG